MTKRPKPQRKPAKPTKKPVKRVAHRRPAPEPELDEAEPEDEPEDEPETEPDESNDEPEFDPDFDVDEDVEDDDVTSVDVSASPPVAIPEPPPDDVTPPAKNAPRVEVHTTYDEPHPQLRDASPKAVADYYFEKIHPLRYRALPPTEQKNKTLLIELLTAYRSHLTKTKN